MVAKEIETGEQSGPEVVHYRACIAYLKVHIILLIIQ